MAKSIPASLTVLFLVFAVSSARRSLDLLGNEVVNADSETQPKTATSNPIVMPSEIPAETRTDWEPTESQGETLDTLEVSTASGASETVPLTLISLRPINRHGFRRPFPLSFRVGHRCRHNHRLKPWNPRREIPYGNDMIVADKGEELRFDDPASFHVEGRDHIRKLPAHVRPILPRMEIEINHPHHHHHPHPYPHPHHHHEHEEYDLQEQEPMEREHDHGHGDGFLVSFRKFLKHF